MDAPLTVKALRERSEGLLRGAQEVFVPTVDTMARFSRYFPALGLNAVPWQAAPAPISLRPARSVDRLRVAVIGAIGKPKGYELLLECARDAVARDRNIEFVVVGYTVDDQTLLDTGRVFVTGPYQESEVPALLHREGCDVAFFPSVTPETWCYSLTHAMEFGLPIVALDLGAQAERLRDYPAVRLLRAHCTVEEANCSLLQAATDSHTLRGEQKGAMESHRSPDSLTQEDSPRELVSSVQTLKLPAGIYSFSIKDGALPHGDDGALALPALQLGVAPVRSAGKIEFLSGGATLDRWLAYGTDRMLVRILGGDASVLLTSVYRASSHSLAVDVKRLHALMPQSALGSQSVTEEAGVQRSLPVRLLAHIRFVGDLDFEGGAAGWPGQQMWIEGFAIMSIGNLPTDGFEYRGLVANGFLTPWLRSPTFCGSRGGGLPLVGFAVRLSPQCKEHWDCGYSATFLSGAKRACPTDGELCSAGAANDPLESMEVFVRERNLTGMEASSVGYLRTPT